MFADVATTQSSDRSAPIRNVLATGKTAGYPRPIGPITVTTKGL